MKPGRRVLRPIRPTQLGGVFGANDAMTPLGGALLIGGALGLTWLLLHIATRS